MPVLLAPLEVLLAALVFRRATKLEGAPESLRGLLELPPAKRGEPSVKDLDELTQT